MSSLSEAGPLPGHRENLGVPVCPGHLPDWFHPSTVSHNPPLYSLKETETHGRAVPNIQHPRDNPFLSHFLQCFMSWGTQNLLCGGDMWRSLGRNWCHQPGVQPWSPQRTLRLCCSWKSKYMICFKTLCGRQTRAEVKEVWAPRGRQLSVGGEEPGGDRWSKKDRK